MDDVRTFVNDPNPPPSAGGLLSSSGIARPLAIPPPSAEVPSPSRTSTPVMDREKDEGSFWVSAAGKDGKHKIFETTPDGDDHEIGTTGNPEVSKILDTVVKRNEFTGAWRGVPKTVALSLKSDELGLADYVHAMYDAGKAGTAEGMIGWQALAGKMTDAEALDKANPELLKMQVKSAFKPWSDGRLASMASAFPWALGVAAKALPSMVEGVGRGAELAPTMALGTTMLAAAGGPAGLAVLATPAGVGSVLSASASAGMFDFTSRVTAGSIYLDLQRQGIDPKIAKRMAPMAGILAGSLEVVGFKYFTAAAKRTFLNKVMGNTAVKKVMTNWVANYLKETSAEVGVETAQQLVEEYTKNFARMADDKPELLMSQKDIMKAAGQAGIEAFVAFGVLKAPMAGIEGIASKTGEGKKAEVPAATSTPAPAATPALASAQAVETQLVSDTPEIAQAMAELNGELDPTAEDASIQYEEMGKELAGDENASAAVSAKIEALRMELSDIALKEGANTPIEQRRIVEIQNEISLLGGMQGAMGEGENAQFDEEWVSGEQTAPTAPLSEKKLITGVKKRVEAAVTKARDAKLVSEMDSTLAVVKELEMARDRLAKAEKPTKLLDSKIASLMERVYKIDEERNAISSGEKGTTDGGKLEMTPATLESIKKAAFTEGRREVIGRRAELIAQVAEHHGLSDRDVKFLTKNRNLGIMSDFNFKTYIDDLRKRAQKLAERKQALTELTAVQSAKELKREANIRKFHDLPPVSKMTAEQMRQYAEILEGYETGDEFWTPKRMDALKETRWNGATTLREVLEKAAAFFGLKGVDDLRNVKVSEFDRFRYDTALARRNAFYNFMVDEVKLAELKNAATYFQTREELFRLADAAVKSRAEKGNGGIGKAFANWLAPQQAEVMAFMEAEPGSAEKAAAGALLTSEELALAQFMEKTYADAYAYLLAGKDIGTSRFTGGRYVFHARKPVSEILLGLKENGVRETISELFQQWKLDDTKFAVTDERTGQVLGLRKFFRQTLFRSGEMAPSKNIVRSTDVYLRQFFKKKALDEAVPSVETLAMALSSLDRTEDGKAMNGALQSFIKTYLNAKKGQAAITGITQGGVIDAGIRFTTSLVSLNMIALNIPLQVASVVGETVAKVPALGVSKLALANYRKLTPQGRKIVAKYKFFTGEGVLEEFSQPGQNIENRLGMVVYGIFKWSRMNTMRDLILGNMTPEEFAAGEIAPEKLAEIKKAAGRWIDIGDAKSVMGKTSAGSAAVQFKSWAVPIMSSSLDIAASLTRSLTKMGDPAKRLSAQQTTEIYRLVEATALASLVVAWAGAADKDDDSMLGRVKFYALRELTTLTQAMSMARALTVPVALKWVERLAKNLELLMTLTKTKATGELTGWKGLKRQMPLARILPSEGKKKGPPKPVKFKSDKRGD